MSLIDYFNAFQGVSEARHLSANARSLYYAILSEFNRLRYPPELKLENTYLQHLSSVTSAHSFDSARNALINANVIAFKKRTYRLTNPQDICPNGNFSENKRKLFGKKTENAPGLIPVPLGSSELKKEEDRGREENPPPPKGFNGSGGTTPLNSEITAVWRECEGTPLSMQMANALANDAATFGTQAVIDAIRRASLANSRQKISYNFLKTFLVKKQIPKQIPSQKNDWANSKLDEFLKED